MRHKEGGLDITPVRVLPLSIEYLIVQINVVVVDGIIKCDSNHLGHILAVGTSGANSAEPSGNLGSILGTETVGQFADGGVTDWSTVGISLDICKGQSKPLMH